MELPVGEVQQRFKEAMAAAERGEPVLVTEDGAPVAELKPLSKRSKIDWKAADRVRQELGLGGHSAEEVWPPEFDDPAFSRKVLGLE